MAAIAMTTYQDLCKVFAKEAPRRQAIDRMLRELPAKMAQAISNYLAAPIGCVRLYHPMVDQQGRQVWQVCGDDCLHAEYNGIFGFCVGIRTEFESGTLSYSTLYFEFSVEEFDEKSMELRIKKLDGVISIANAQEPASYADAAKTAIDLLLRDLENPKRMRGSRSPIGFGHP